MLAKAVYRDGTDTAFFLDKNTPSYIGGILEMADHRRYGITLAFGFGQPMRRPDIVGA